MTAHPLVAPPVHLPGPDAPWDDVHERARATGRVVVHTTWGEWLYAALLDPELRGLLGRDWPRYRQTPAAADRFTFAVSRMVIKYTAAAVLEAAPADLDIAYQPGGRPVLRGFGEELHLSLAHTEELVVVAVSGSGPVGVDTESVDREASYALLRAQVCTPEEAKELDALPEDERRLRFLRLWTLKEAYTKALGHGMRRRFNAVGFTWDAEGRAVLAEPSAAAPGWSFATHLVGDRYLVSEAHRDGPLEIRSRHTPGEQVGPAVPPAPTVESAGPGHPAGR
ncbi:4'-phosphopantetheinyl transferase superfamily protein (plasmid) [Streptomyces sp. HUAS MG91]|uniref:4'-phosphopantetheinyl transferase superfamily protein n=1 Tax=Streptomyces tabacisoli TaxID=3156398 RepID=A0AAU8J7P1_9ACTN